MPINLFYQPGSACARSHFQETGWSISKVLEKLQLVSIRVNKQPGTMGRSFTEGKILELSFEERMRICQEES